MAAAHLRMLEISGYENICCTVSPKNQVSLKNLLPCGFTVRALSPKFAGWWRYILYKRVNQHSSRPKEAASEEEIGVACSDIEGQRELIRKGYERI